MILEFRLRVGKTSSLLFEVDVHSASVVIPRIGEFVNRDGIVHKVSHVSHRYDENKHHRTIIFLAER